MYNIKVKTGVELVEPMDMFYGENEDQCFQMYQNGKPCNHYFFNCGHGEKNLVTLWYNDESREWRFSTDDQESIHSLNKTVKVAKVDIQLRIKTNAPSNC
jgi:hypothetical protein